MKIDISAGTLTLLDDRNLIGPTHSALVLPVDLLVSQQPSSSDSRLRHPIPDEQDDILHHRLLSGLMDSPSSDSLLVPVLQGRGIITWLGEGERSVGFRRDVDRGGGFGVLCEEVFKVLERPSLELGILSELEERGDIRRITLVVGDGE